MKLDVMHNDVMDQGMARLGLGSGINNMTSKQLCSIVTKPNAESPHC